MKKWFVAAYLAALIGASAQTYEQKIASAMERVDRVAAKGPFNPDWKSLESYQAPEWYLDAKFGIFIHWSVSKAGEPP